MAERDHTLLASSSKQCQDQTWHSMISSSVTPMCTIDLSIIYSCCLFMISYGIAQRLADLGGLGPHEKKLYLKSQWLITLSHLITCLVTMWLS